MSKVLLAIVVIILAVPVCLGFMSGFIPAFNKSLSAAYNKNHAGATGESDLYTKQTSMPKPDPRFYSVKIGSVTYDGAQASNVGVAIVGGGFLPVASMSSASYLQVEVAVTNMQRDEITMTSSLFRLIGPNGEVYSPDTDLEVNDINNEFFLTGINPGITRAGGIIFQVPSGISPSNMRLQFRGGMTGETAIIPLSVHAEGVQASKPMTRQEADDYDNAKGISSHPLDQDDGSTAKPVVPAPKENRPQPHPPVDFVVNDLPSNSG